MMPEFIGELLGLALIVVVFVVIKMRGDNLLKFSEESGFKKLKDTQKYKQNIPNFEVFHKAKEISNMLVKNTSKATIRIIDHEYTALGTQTLLMIESKDLILPDFTITPKKLISSNGIQFNNLPKFSSKYKVKGNNEEQIKEILSSEFINLLLTMKKLHLEAKDNKIIIYRPKTKLKVKKITKFLTELNQLYNLLKSNDLSQ